jgi:four helix bundle protein
MATIKYFQDLQIWQKARGLNKEIYQLTESPSFAKDFSLKDQMRRASISILSNIAEGFDREGNKEFLQFLSIVKGSLAELHSQLYAFLDIKYIDDRAFEN